MTRRVASTTAALLLSACAAFHGEPSRPAAAQPADLARAVLETLRNNRPGEFMAFALSPKEIRRHVADAQVSPSDGQGSFQLSRGELLAMLMENRAGMRPRFTSIRARAAEEGVHWPSVKFTSAPARLEMRAARLYADHIDILFESRGHGYRLRLDDCLSTKRGWLMLDRMIWRGRVHKRP